MKCFSDLLDSGQDDRIEMNTQAGTQWDGFRHVGYADGRHYNGFTQAEVESGKSTHMGVDRELDLSAATSY